MDTANRHHANRPTPLTAADRAKLRAPTITQQADASAHKIARLGALVFGAVYCGLMLAGCL